MRRFKVSHVAFVFCMLCMPYALMAQGLDPLPICCPPSPVVAGENQKDPLAVQGQLLISSSMLQTQGITRRQFADRLSMSLFPGRSVDVILSSRSFVARPALSGSSTGSANQNQEAGLPSLIAIQETAIYRVPLQGMAAEALDSIDQFGLSDGEVQITIKFVNSASL